jgi:hypothetical protein
MKSQSAMKTFVFAAFALTAATLTACNGSDSSSNALTLAPGSDPSKVPTQPVPIPSPDPSGSPAPTGKLYSGPAEVEKYVVKFVDDAKAHGVNVLPNMSNPTLTIQFASLSSYGSSVIGLCETTGSLRRVTFSPTFWNSASETQRELLAHHELGHCVLYRPHKTSLLSSGAYASIMYPIILASSTYLGNQEYYLNELYTSSVMESAGEAVTGVHVCDQEDLQSLHPGH